MSDLISRQATIDALAKYEKSNGHNYTLFMDIVSECAEIIRDLPSVETKRKKGKWIYEGKRGRFPACRCSECGNVENADWAILGDNVNYCPNCGARMEEENEGH